MILFFFLHDSFQSGMKVLECFMQFFYLFAALFIHVFSWWEVVVGGRVFLWITLMIILT